MSSMNARPQPTHTAPITVAEIDAVGAWRVAEIPFSTNASASATMTPPTIQSTPPVSAPTSASMPPM